MARMGDETLRLRAGMLEIESLEAGDSHLISLAGELDLASCPALETELRSVETNGAARIVLDLSGLEFIDSTGIALLVAALRRSENDSGRLRFVRSRSEEVCRLLEICGLEGSLPYVD